jgi:hypothetical protein
MCRSDINSEFDLSKWSNPVRKREALQTVMKKVLPWVDLSTWDEIKLFQDWSPLIDPLVHLIQKLSPHRHSLYIWLERMKNFHFNWRHVYFSIHINPQTILSYMLCDIEEDDSQLWFQVSSQVRFMFWLDLVKAHVLGTLLLPCCIGKVKGGGEKSQREIVLHVDVTYQWLTFLTTETLQRWLSSGSWDGEKSSRTMLMTPNVITRGFFFHLFISAYNIWVISPPFLPLPSSPPSFPGRNSFAFISNFVEERV